MPTLGRGTRASVPRFSSLEQGTASSTWICRSSLPGAGSLTVTRGRRNPPAPPWEHPLSTQQAADSAQYFSTPPARSFYLLQLRTTPSPDPRGRRATPAEQTELPRVCVSPLRAHAGPRASTRHPHACHGAAGCCSAPCQPRGDGTETAIPRGAGASWPSQPSHGHCTARIQRENGQAESDPQARGGGSAGQNHALIYRPSQEPDLHPPCGDSLAQSSLPPWSSHQCVAIPRGCPEQGETQVLFSSWNCLGKAEPRSIATASPQHPRKCLLPAPQLLHPVLTEMVPTHKETWCFTHGSELRNSCSARVQLWSPKSNSSAGAKGSRAGAGAQNSSHKGELSSNVKQCPALFPRFVECFCVWDTDSSKFLELCLLPANFPGTSSTLAANKPRCLQVEAPE